MIRNIFTLSIIFFSFNSFCQDVILYKSGDEIKAKVLKINKENIVFKKFDNINGPDYSEEKNNIFMITYSNGEKDIINEISNSNEFELDNLGKEITYYQGVPIISYTESDAVIAVSLKKGRKYGKYYIAEVLIFNLTGKNIDFIPEQFIMANCIKKGIAKTGTILSYDQYNKKVKTAQGWRTFAVAFAETYNASQAGYSSSYSSGSANVYGSSSTNWDAYGFGSGGSWANAYGSSNTYGSATIYGSSSTQSYNGAANYAAQQNAGKNISNFESYQKQKRDVIQYEYLKRHTLKNGEELTGKINIKYQDADVVEIFIIFNGKEYAFEFTSDLIKKIES